MSVKKGGASPTREGTPPAGREAARAGAPERPTSPARPRRRTFTAEYKLRIVREAEVAQASGIEGAVGELLRREGLYSSHLTEWRRMAERGELAALAPRKRGRKSSKDPVADENARLHRENARLKEQLEKANIIIDVQKKVAALLGNTVTEPTVEDFARDAEARSKKER